jgi:hypothetical protein
MRPLDAVAEELEITGGVPLTLFYENDAEGLESWACLKYTTVPLRVLHEWKLRLKATGVPGTGHSNMPGIG